MFTVDLAVCVLSSTRRRIRRRRLLLWRLVVKKAIEVHRTARANMWRSALSAAVAISVSLSQHVHNSGVLTDHLSHSAS